MFVDLATAMKLFRTRFAVLASIILLAVGSSVRAASTLSAGGSSAAAVEGVLALTWGHNAFSQLGHSAGVTAVARPTLLAGEWSKVAMGSTFALALGADGRLYAWGANDDGQLGDGTVSSTPRTSPSPVALPAGAEVLDFVVGQRHALALVNLPASGTTPAVSGAIYAWGSNIFGQLGQGANDLVRRPAPVRVIIGTKARPLAAARIAATDFSSFAIATNRTLWSWGGNLRGELGRGAKLTARNQYSGAPARVGTAATWTEIAGGSRHVIALRGKQLAVWGDNSFGQCAKPLRTSVVLSPALVALPSVSAKVPRLPAAVAAGLGHSLVLSTTGEVWGFGLRINGALGAFDPASLQIHQLKAALLPFSGPVSHIVAGSDFTLARLVSGGVVGLGANQFGQLGDGTLRPGESITVPVASLLGGPVLTVSQPPLVGAEHGVGTSVGPMALTVRNGGTAAQTLAYRVSVYVSPSATLNADARLLRAITVETDLAAAASTAVEFSAADLVLAHVAPGTYHLISQVVPLDADGAVSDDFDPHSGASASFTVAGPDLTTDGVITLANTLVSEAEPRIGSVSLQVRNVNVGIVPAGAKVVVEAYLSGDTTLHPASDSLLKRQEVTVPAGGLSPGEALAVILGDLEIPGRTSGGNYHLIIAINRDGALSESGVAANFVHVPVRVAAHDLAVSAPTLPEGGVGFAATVPRITVNVQNLGELAYDSASGFTVELYLSSSAQFAFTASKIGSVSVTGAIAAQGGRLVVFENIALPVTLRDQVYFHARVVADPALGDRFPANNVASVGVQLEPAQLKIDEFKFPNTTSVQAGGSFGNVTYRLANTGIGLLPAGFPVGVEVFLSSDGTIDRGRDVLLDRYAYAGGVAAGGGVVLPLVDRPLLVPDGVANGIYQLIFTVNTDGAQPELPFVTVTRAASVGVLDATVSAPAVSSANLGVNTVIEIVDVTVGNQGGFPIPAGLAVELYLSVDGTFDTSDTLLRSMVLPDALDGRSTRAVPLADVAIPDFGQGNFYLLARLVLPAGLVDLDYTNNVGATPISLSRPSVEVDELDTPAQVNLDNLDPVISGLRFDLVNTSLGAIPPGTPLRSEIYLSRDDLYDPSDRLLFVPPAHEGGLTGAYDAVGSRVTVGPMDVPLPDSLVGGTYHVIVVVNREGGASLDTLDPVVEPRVILLEKENAAGRAFDYGMVSFTGDGEWRFVTDARATDRSALQSPALQPGQSASVSLQVTGPTELHAPWSLQGSGGDALALSVHGSVVNVLDQFDPVYRLSGPGVTPVVVPSGTGNVTWTYQQSTSNLGHFGRLDLDLPSFVSTGDGDWFGVNSAEAKVGPSYARSPELAAGKQAVIEVDVTGPAMVSFWWRASGVLNQDTLGFYIDGSLASLPTTTFDAVALPALISNQPDWRRVAFLIEGGVRRLRWVYTQGSADTLAQGNVDGLVVSSPAPITVTPNRDTDQTGAHAAVPPVTLDLAVRTLSAPFGTYLLDDAQSTSRLPVRVSAVNRGSPYIAQPSWSAADLELRFSTDKVWGNDDDLVLGNFARFQVATSGDEVVFDVEVNLPFTLPDGTYFLMARVRDHGGATEFTYANNTAVLGETGAGNAFVIVRAPNIVVGNFSGLSASYPYHPEDAVYVTYDLANMGLGDLRPEQKFKVRLSLHALKDRAETDLTKSVLIRNYPDREFSLFLPTARAAYPDASMTTVTHFVDLPSLRDFLVGIGEVPAGTPEDAALVSAKQSLMTLPAYFFRVWVDVENQVAESSETNLFWISQFFNTVPVPYVENVGSFLGSPAFSDFISDRNQIFTGSTFDYTAVPPAANTFTRYIWDYALYRAPLGTPNLLFQEDQQNGVIRADVPPYGPTEFQTLTFDFNVRSNDVVIEVQATDDGLAGGTWETIQTLRPPYNAIFGAQSLTGYGGLSSSPYVLAVEGNVTFVQKVYAARITVRDRLPISERGAANQPRMRIVVTPAPGVVVPPPPTALAATLLDTSVVLNWTGTITPNVNGVQAAYIVERSRDGVSYRMLGSTTSTFFIDTSPGSRGTNIYRVRSISTAGTSDPDSVIIVLN